MEWNLAEELRKVVKGEVENDPHTLAKYSRDTSLYEVMPQVVVFPKDVEDVKAIVEFVEKHKEGHPELSITGRSAGTDMTGGSINESIILVFTKYFKKEAVDVENLSAVIEPGVFYRDFEKETLPAHISFPPYPASKNIAAIGGMIMNNSSGERTLRYGPTANFVEEVTMVLADGREHTFSKLDRMGLTGKLSLNGFEGDLYRRLYDLLEANYNTIQRAKPKVSKNTAGYALWDIWNKETFDMTKLFVGSQGTLGILTRAKVRLVKDKMHKRLITVFFKSWNPLPEVVNALLPHDPESLETYDRDTLKLALRFMPEIAKGAHEPFFRFAFRFMPEFMIGLRMLGLPKLVVLVELAEDTEEALDAKTKKIEEALAAFPVMQRTVRSKKDAEKYWLTRRESFNLLRKHVHGKQTAPFIEDFCVLPEDIPEFLPRLLEILKDHDIKANIAGHAGNGNFHIIPLMDLSKEWERKKIPVVMDKVYDLVIEYGGTIAAEHNDGILRTPYLEKMYGPEMYRLFGEVKRIFDPDNIFNPGKKYGGTKEYAEAHMAVRQVGEIGS